MSNARVKRKAKAICKKNGDPYLPIREWDLSGMPFFVQMNAFLHKMGLARDPFMINTGKRWQNEYVEKPR